MTPPYFDDLATRLRSKGLSEDAVTGTIDDLTTYMAESGGDPEEEFGTPEEFAARLVRAEDEPGPAAEAETWTWTADAFQDRSLLNRFGDQGWEVERIDTVGRFVSRRDAERPQRWEYRREVILPGRRRAVIDRLAPDGWEPCGTWVHWEYFKRPKAADIGPEAELRDPPETPAGRFFYGRRFRVFAVCYLVLLATAGVAWTVFVPAESRSSFLNGMLTGAIAAPVGITAFHLWNEHRRRRE